MSAGRSVCRRRSIRSTSSGIARRVQILEIFVLGTRKTLRFLQYRYHVSTSGMVCRPASAGVIEKLWRHFAATFYRKSIRQLGERERRDLDETRRRAATPLTAGGARMPPRFGGTVATTVFIVTRHHWRSRNGRTQHLSSPASQANVISSRPHRAGNPTQQRTIDDEIQSATRPRFGPSCS